MRSIRMGALALLMALVLLVTMGASQRFDWLIARKLTVQDGGATINAGGLTVTADDLTVAAGNLVATAGDVQAGDDLIAGDDINVTGDAVVNGGVTLGTFFNPTAQSTLTLTNSGTLTATGSIQPITSVADVTLGGADIVHNTEWLVLLNVGSFTITMTEESGLISGGDIVLGPTDAAGLLWRGTSWYKFSGSDN